MSDDKIMLVIPETVRGQNGPEPERIYHLPKGRMDAAHTWQPIHCGGGIANPWRSAVERSRVCPTCLRVAKR